LIIHAQPGIGQNAVVNRASQIPSTLAGGAIARGAAFTIRGVRFGSSAAVSVRNGNVVLPVRVLAVEPERIEALMPDAAPLGRAALVVTAGGSSSKPFSMEIAASNPGIFSQNKMGWGPGQIDNIDTLGKRALNSNVNPAMPGQRVAMNITGLGKGIAARVVVGNRTVTAGAARTTSPTGEQEISFPLPPDTPLGCFVPVYLEASPTRASNVVTIAVQSAANRSAHCDSGPIPALEAKRVGMAVVTRSNIYKSGGNSDKVEAIATFAVRDPAHSLSPLLLLPPPGTCTAYTSSLQATNTQITVSTSLYGELGTEGLAAGPQLAVSRDNRRRIIPWDRGSVGYYHAHLPPRFFNPGKFFLSGPGGIDVAAFRVMSEVPAPFEWTDREQTQVVTRSHSLALHWRGQANGRWTILLATNVDQVSTAIGTCLCTAPLNATHFEIPPALLANIPASSNAPGYPYDQIFVSMLSKAVPLKAAGIGAGTLFTVYSNGRAVQFH
jgi:uncharacterized protein (TIGR03437 family)